MEGASAGWTGRRRGRSGVGYAAAEGLVAVRVKGKSVGTIERRRVGRCRVWYLGAVSGNNGGVDWTSWSNPWSISIRHHCRRLLFVLLESPRHTDRPSSRPYETARSTRISAPLLERIEGVDSSCCGSARRIVNQLNLQPNGVRRSRSIQESLQQHFLQSDDF